MQQPLPPGWRRAPLAALVGDDGVFTDGDWVESKDQDPDGDVRLIQLADVGDGEYRDRSARFLTRKKAEQLRCTFLKVGDVLVARMPDPLGRACIFPGDKKPAVTVVDVCVVRPAGGAVATKWLCYALNSPQVRVQVAGHQAGTTRKRISRSNLGTVELNVPPLAEQEWLVAEIEKQFTRLDAGVEALKRLQAHLRRYRAAVLKTACEGALVPRPGACGTGQELLEEIRGARLAAHLDSVSKKPYVAPLPARPTNELPDGWAWATVEELTRFDRPSGYGVLQPGKDVDGGVPLVRVGDIANGRVATTGLKTISPSISAAYERTVLHGGELLITLVGTIGRTAVAPTALGGANTARAVGVVPLTDLVDARWVEVWFRSPLTQRRMVGLSHEVARKTLNLEDVRSAPVPLPTLAEQRAIVERVEELSSEIDATELVVEASLHRAMRMRASILRRAFEGTLARDPTRPLEHHLG